MSTCASLASNPAISLLSPIGTGAMDAPQSTPAGRSRWRRWLPGGDPIATGAEHPVSRTRVPAFPAPLRPRDRRGARRGTRRLRGKRPQWRWWWRGRWQVQDTAARHGLLLDEHPADLQPLLRDLVGVSRRTDRRPGSPADRRSVVRRHGQRPVDGDAQAPARQAGQRRRQLPGTEDRGRAEHLRSADAAGLSGHAVRRRRVPERRRHRRHPHLGDGVRAKQLTAFVVAAALLALGAGLARAEPYLAVRTGAKCSDCHTNLDGGGKRTSFATIHAHDILHDLQILPLPKGVRSFNGELNQWVSIGSDLRVRSTTTFVDTPDAQGRVPTNRAFRDHVDTETLNVPEALGYLQVDLWPEILTLYGDFNAAGGGVTAREALAIVHLPFNTFLKAGRYFPPFGLRVYEDASFIRTNTGFTFQNPDEGGEVGMIQGPFYLAASATNGTPGDTSVLTTVNGYGMFDDLPVVRNVLTGASYAHQSSQRQVAAFYAGSNLWKFTYLGEFDIIDDNTTLPANTGRDQFASYAEVDLLLFDWLNIRGTFDFLKVSGNRNQTRYQIGAQPFIARFIQPRLYYVINNGPENQPQQNTTQVVFELHFFF